MDEAAPRDPLEAVAGYVSAFGVAARPVREAIAALTEGPHTLDDLITSSGLSRRAVEGLLTHLDGDLDGAVTQPGGAAIRPDRVAAYRERFDHEQLGRTRLTDWAWSRRGDLTSITEWMAALVDGAPAPVRSLDHVSATPQTLARRALWLDGNYDLTGARVLCVGDHDLTSLALGLANPAVQVTVVDIDERILELIDTEAGRLGLNVRCLFADLRFGVPPVAAGWADMAITDPPYTPEGVQLFATRGLQGLHGRDAGRLVVAYGFGESQPALGHKVQRAMLDLYLTFEAVDPGFNRYRGAQAVGSASELYVCRPTPRTWRALPKLAATAAANIYTRGSQAREAVPTGTASEVFDEVVAAAAGPRELPVGLTIGRSSTLSATVSVGIDQLLTEGMPSSVARGNPHAAVADLSAGQSGWLLRVLLVTNADRLALLVPNNHPDLASEAAQRQLITLVWDKYALRFRRSSPSPRHAIVEAERIDAAGLGPTAWLARWILDRAHGTVGSVWRDGLVRLSRDLATETLTKNQARTLVRDAAPNPDMLTGRLVDLPRHQVAGLLTSMTTAAGGLEAG